MIWVFRYLKRCGRDWLISWAIHSSLKEIQDDIELVSYRSDEGFLKKTREALNLIKTRDAVNFRRVTSFIHMITDLGFGGGYYDPKRHAYHGDQFEVRRESVAAHAAAIIHEAVHGRLESCRIAYKGNETRHENLCKQVQVRFLDRIDEQRLASAVRSSEEWWIKEAVTQRQATFIESMQNEFALGTGLVDRCLSHFYGSATRRFKNYGKQIGFLPLRQYQQENLTVLEFDCDGDGRLDQWEYYDRGVISRVEIDSQKLGFINQRDVYADGQLSRIEKLQQNGVPEYIGYVKYAKQGTQKEIYWTQPNGRLTTIQVYVGKELLGKAILDDLGVVTETLGNIRYKVGDKLSMESHNLI